VRKPRTEQHFEAMHKRAENLRKLLIEYRKYADYLESLLDQPQSHQHPFRSVDFRASRPSDSDTLFDPDLDLDEDFDFTVGEEEITTGSDAGSDPTKEICLPAQSLKVCKLHYIMSDGPLIDHACRLRKEEESWSMATLPPSVSTIPYPPP